MTTDGSGTTDRRRTQDPETIINSVLQDPATTAEDIIEALFTGGWVVAGLNHKGGLDEVWR